LVAGPNPVGHGDDEDPPNATKLHPEGMTILQDPESMSHPPASPSRGTLDSTDPSLAAVSGAASAGAASLWTGCATSAIPTGDGSLVVSLGAFTSDDGPIDPSG
jgi:hypothetical protein